MCSKSLNGRKVKKILVGVFVFFAANMSVFGADCNGGKAINKSGTNVNCEKVCETLTENGYKCTYKSKIVTRSDKNDKSKGTTSCYCKTGTVLSSAT